MTGIKIYHFLFVTTDEDKFGKVFVKIEMKRFNGRCSLNSIKKSSDQKEFNSVFEIKFLPI
ncbi:MAG TPA: hypothetical protein DER09_05145 [Prolixibacteraceae bacterium]|nr:hypothetical protein [Prolixibacteraceae bacterium]